MPYVITITGPSGAGKSTTVRYLLGHKRKGFIPGLVPKYTTRPPRDDDHGEVICVEAIPDECDLTYEHCEYQYGLNLSQLFDIVAEDLNPIVILNDVRTVEEVRSFLNGSVRSVFILRESPSLERYRDLARSRGVTDEQEPVRRFLQARAFYHIYNENIHLFDHVILNSGTFGELDAQVKQVIRGLEQDPSQSLRAKDNKTFTQRLFVIVGTPGSGKDWLVQTVNDLGAHQAQIIPKHTSRKRRKNDRNEMICPGDPGHDLDACDIIYENYGDRYGIKTSTILKGLKRGVFQVVVVSNVNAIHELYEMFGELVVLVYIHSETSAEEYQRAEVEHGENTSYVKRRAEGYRSAFDTYLENFLAFNHVLINSGDPGDLLDQIFRLFRAYERGDLPGAPAKPVVSRRIWTIVRPGKEPRIIGK